MPHSLLEHEPALPPRERANEPILPRSRNFRRTRRFGPVGVAIAVALLALSHFASADPAPARQHRAKAQAQAGAAGPAQPRKHVKSRSEPGASGTARGHKGAKKHADGGADAPRRGKHKTRPHRVVHGPDYHPPYADIVIDGNTGQVLRETDADSPRHPASLTKVMTLYLLFEQLQTKKLSLGSRLPISAFAASQSPTKLGLRPNDTIAVEDAIKGLVTRSANDAAVVVAEAIGGSEADFGALMTRKAQLLGMTGTVYVNASGLPADAQITTARDQALLGRAIQERFPEYYPYFALPSFQYRGKPISNHNALLRELEGIDGIKTGYTEASGYNLLSSMRREGRHLVAVVLGGRSNATRDARMRQLLEEHLRLASSQRTAPPITEAEPSADLAATKSLPVSLPAEALPTNGGPSPQPAGLLEHVP